MFERGLDHIAVAQDHVEQVTESLHERLRGGCYHHLLGAFVVRPDVERTLNLVDPSHRLLDWIVQFRIPGQASLSPAKDQLARL